jgi:hemoglobin
MRLKWIAPGVATAALLACLTLGSAHADDSLYRKLGGKDGITAIVTDAYTIILADPRIKDDFDNISRDYLTRRLSELLCTLSGGPCVYHGRGMGAAHEGLSLTRAKFNAVAEDLQSAMDQHDVPYWTQNKLMALLAPMEHQIVTR